MACRYTKPTASTTRSRASLYEYSADLTLWLAARVALIAFQSNTDCVTVARESKYENGPTDDGIVMVPKLVRPNSPRLILETVTYGDNSACGRSALNCSQRCPRAERISVFESSNPRFCFKPRSMASCRESGMTPGTSFVGTDPENEPPAGIPVEAAPCEPELGVVGVGAGVCARAIGE